jgi:hypothetical protein
MFQYAAGRAVALRTRQDLYLFTSNRTANQLTPFRLDDQRDLTPAVGLRAGLTPWPSRRGSRFLRPLAIRSGVEHLTPEAFGIFDERVLGLHGPVVMIGHWQSERYFNDAETTVRHEFELREKPRATVREFATTCSRSPTVAMSVRRGDYLTSMPRDDLPTRAYYESALELLTRELGERPQIVGFSDDRHWLSKEFPKWFPDAAIASGKVTTDPYEELFAQSSCQHQIIAPSSFSWWAAWLNLHPGKIVLAPKKWVYDWAAPDIIPRKWLRV